MRAKKVASLSGIAQPESFERSLLQLGGQQGFQCFLVTALLRAGDTQGEMALGTIGVSNDHAPGFALHDRPVAQFHIMADLFLKMT